MYLLIIITVIAVLLMLLKNQLKKLNQEYKEQQEKESEKCKKEPCIQPTNITVNAVEKSPELVKKWNDVFDESTAILSESKLMIENPEKAKDTDLLTIYRCSIKCADTLSGLIDDMFNYKKQILNAQNPNDKVINSISDIISLGIEERRLLNMNTASVRKIIVNKGLIKENGGN